MPLGEKDVVKQAEILHRIKVREAEELDPIYTYVRGTQPLPVVPAGIPRDVKRLAEMSRVNMIPLVISVSAQAMYVSGYRSSLADTNDPLWDIFQANRLDARQLGITRSALEYGVSYAVVLPGDPVPVVRGVSPRKMTAAYGDDDDWPLWGLEDRGGGIYRLHDDEGYYVLGRDTSEPTRTSDFTFIEFQEHAMGFCPIIRFRNIDDLDDDHVGEVKPLMPLQDQIDLTTFGLLVAQHFQAFRMRYAIGWTADTERELAAAAASSFLTIDEDPDRVKLGEFGQADLGGYLESREATVQHLATVSQTPPHHLLGKLVNLSAEALVAAESGQRRKIDERQTMMGEAWEQVFEAMARASGQPFDPTAQVRWRDTEARALAATVDALGKMATMLKLPVELLWERLPDWSQQDIERAKQMAREADTFASLNAMLDRQMGPVGQQEETVGEQ